MNQSEGNYNWRSTLPDQYIEMLKRKGRWKNAQVCDAAHRVASLAVQLAALDANKEPIFRYLDDACDLLDVTTLFLGMKAAGAQARSLDRDTDEKLHTFENILSDDSLTWRSERGLFKAIERTFGKHHLKVIKKRGALLESELFDMRVDLRRRNQKRTTAALRAKK